MSAVIEGNCPKARQVDNRSLKAVLSRNWVELKGLAPHERVVATKEGRDAMKIIWSTEAPTRKHVDQLSDAVKNLLKATENQRSVNVKSISSGRQSRKRAVAA
jgi:hypothetical protein